MKSLTGGLAKLFLGKQQGKHARTGPFKLTWANTHDVEEPAIGIELATEYAVFATEIEPKTEELDLALTIRDHPIAIRVRVEEKPRFVDGGKPWYRVRAKYIGIEADVYDLLVRELTGVPEPVNRTLAGLQASAGDDDYRLLPVAVQKYVLQYLVSNGRLDQVVEGQLSAVRMRSLGKARDAKGQVIRKINITSRRHLDDRVVSYNTVFLVDPENNVRAIPSD